MKETLKGEEGPPRYLPVSNTSAVETEVEQSAPRYLFALEACFRIGLSGMLAEAFED